jgi:hypothetical protein
MRVSLAWALAILGLSLIGCSSARPEVWVMYGKAAYLYGRVEAVAEHHCGVSPLPVDRQAVCAEAVRTQKAVLEIAPVVRAELSKSSPDWSRIMEYVDLVLGLATRFIR